MAIGIRDINNHTFYFSLCFDNATTRKNWDSSDANGGSTHLDSDSDVVYRYGTELLTFINKLFDTPVDSQEKNTTLEYRFILENNNYCLFTRKKENVTVYFDGFLCKSDDSYYTFSIGSSPTHFARFHYTAMTKSGVFGMNFYPYGDNNYYNNYLCIPVKATDYDSIEMLILYYYQRFDDELGEIGYRTVSGGSDYGKRNLQCLKEWLTGVTPPSRYEDSEDDSGEEHGIKDKSSDDVINELIEPLSQLGGFSNIYLISSNTLSALYTYLWNSQDLIDLLTKMYSKPIDAILNLQIAPLSDSQIELNTPSNIILGKVETDIQARTLKKGFVRIDCGELNIKEYYGNFLDYAPYTKIECYIPFIGFIPLDISDIMRGKIQLYYDIDLCNGFFTANIIVKRNAYGTKLNSILYSQSGNMFYSVPISSTNYSNIVSSATNLVTSMASQNYIGAVSNALAIATAQPTIQHSGNLSNSANLTTTRIPYIRITRQRLAVAKSLQNEKGFLSNVTHKLNDLYGYVEVKHCDVTGINALESEKSEIETLLLNGIFI